MLQAESLHREVALLSNDLHTYADNDVAGVKPVIDKIIATRLEWKDVQLKIKHFDEFGYLPEEKEKRVKAELGDDASEAEIQVELTKCQNLIRQKRYKIANQPDAANHQKWIDELAKEELREIDLKTQLIEIKYA